MALPTGNFCCLHRPFLRLCLGWLVLSPQTHRKPAEMTEAISFHWALRFAELPCPISECPSFHLLLTSPHEGEKPKCKYSFSEIHSKLRTLNMRDFPLQRSPLCGFACSHYALFVEFFLFFSFFESTFSSPSDGMRYWGWTPGGYSAGQQMVPVSELASLGWDLGFIFAVFTHLVSPLSALDVIQSPFLPLKKEGHTLPRTSYYPAARTGQFYEPSKCSRLHVRTGVLTSGLEDYGQVGLWSILKAGFSLLLVSKAIFFITLWHRLKKKSWSNFCLESKAVIIFQKCEHFWNGYICSAQGAFYHLGTPEGWRSFSTPCPANG